MISLCKEYVLCHSVEEALLSLAEGQGSARIVAGGSDLLLELQQGIHPPVRLLVDVSQVDEMCSLEVRQDTLFIGASVVLTRLANTQLVIQHAQALADAAAIMASPQVCNIATIGGNVAHALPAADGTIALLALDAQAEIANSNGRCKAPLQGLFKGPGQSTLNPTSDVLVGFYIPLRRDGEASAFVRRVSPQGIPLALLNMAIWLRQDNGRVASTRIAVGPSGPVPLRMMGAENVMVGQVPNLENQANALQALLDDAHVRTSLHRTSQEYRQHLAEVLFTAAFNTAWHRVHHP